MELIGVGRGVWREGIQGVGTHQSHLVTGVLSLVLGREWDVKEEDTRPRPTWLKPPGQGPGGNCAAANFTGEWHTGARGARSGVHTG